VGISSSSCAIVVGVFNENIELLRFDLLPPVVSGRLSRS